MRDRERESRVRGAPGVSPMPPTAAPPQALPAAAAGTSVCVAGCYVCVQLLCRIHMLLTAACATAAAAPSEAAPAAGADAGADAGDAERRRRRRWSSDACARSSSGVSLCTFVLVKHVN